MTYYRVSALACGFARMWRGWSVIVPVVVVNAILQALLVWPDATPMVDALAVVVAIASGLVFLIAYGLLNATALGVADGHVGWPEAVSTLHGRAGRFAIWAIALGVLTAIGLAFYTVPGIIVLDITPFVLLATLDGQNNPLAVNFRTIGRRFWRWLVTALIMTLVLLVGSILSAVFTFFTRNPLASLGAWLVWGLFAAWITTAWALVYRSAQVETAGQAPTEG